MANSKDMILADALHEAINANVKIIKQRRILIASAILNVILVVLVLFLI